MDEKRSSLVVGAAVIIAPTPLLALETPTLPLLLTEYELESEVDLGAGDAWNGGAVAAGGGGGAVVNT